MEVGKISVRPSDRKIKKVKATAQKMGILPKEMPIEKKFSLTTMADTFERVKDKIQISIDKLTRG